MATPAGSAPLPEGAPPRAGIVTASGNLVVWRDGRAEVLAGVPGDAYRAVQTPYGVVVLHTVDRLTGTMLVEGDEAGVTGWLVIGQEVESRNVPVTENADLVPGGTHLIDFRYSPPAVTLFDVATGGADPRIWWLPAGCDTSVPRSPAWEDEDHLLFRQPYAPRTPAVRLHIRTGAVEGVPLPGIGAMT